MSTSVDNVWQYSIRFKGDNGSLIRSYGQTQIRGDNNNNPSWSFSSDRSANQQYNYLELFRFVAKNNSQTINPKNITLIVEVNDGTAKGITEMVAQIGNQYITARPSSTKPQSFKFDLSEISEYLDGTVLGNQATATEQTITIVPLYEPDSVEPDTQINLLGKESIVVSISGKNYWNADKNDFSGRADFITLKTSTDFNNYDPSYPNPVTVGGKSYDLIVGALADYMLKHPGKKPIRLIIDGYKNSGVVQSSKLLLSQNIIYRESGSQKPWETLGLAYDGQIYVQGSMQEEKPTDYTKQGAVIDGGNTTGDVNNKQYQYSAGMLDLISTYQSTSSNPSIAVKGITFINNPYRGYGAITANTVFIDAIHQDDWDTSGTYDDKLAAAITAHNQKRTIDWKKQQANDVVFYDNQISTWLDRSDGFESSNTNQSSGLRVEKNFIHTADDSLKVGGSNQKFIDNTVHTGKAGSPVLISDYGITAGPVNNTVIDGLYAHRVIQAEDDNYGGIIAYRTHYSENLYDPQKPGINNTHLNNIYVPQFNFQGHPKLVANPVYRHSIVPAMGQAGWSTLDNRSFGPEQAGGYTYNAGGLKVSGWNVNPAAQQQSGDRKNPYFLIGYYDPVAKTPQWNDEINSTPADQLVISRPIYDKYPGNQSGKVNVYGVTHLKDVTNKILASHQTSESDAILDANNIFANPASFKVEITTNSAFMNKLYLAPLIKDEITGDFFADDTDGNRISVDNTDNFRNAIRNEPIPLFADNTLYGGEGNRYEFSFKLMPSESSYYTPVLINPNDELFTYGELSSYGFDNLRVFADQSNTFYFEDQKGLGDNDRNDLIAKFTVI